MPYPLRNGQIKKTDLSRQRVSFDNEFCEAVDSEHDHDRAKPKDGVSKGHRHRKSASHPLSLKEVPTIDETRLTFEELGELKELRQSASFADTSEAKMLVGNVPRAMEAEIHLFHGVGKVVDILMNDPRYMEKSIVFQRDSWVRTVFTAYGRANLGMAWYMVNLHCIFFVGIIHGLDGVVNIQLFDAISSLPSTPLKLMGAGLLFLVIFHTQSAYQKWSFARNVWNNINASSRDIALMSSAYIKDFQLASRMCRYVIAFVVSVRFWVRSEELNPELLEPILTQGGLEHLMTCNEPSTEDDKNLANDNALSFQFRKTCVPLAALDVLRGILNEVVEQKQIGPFSGPIEACIKSLGQSLANAEKVLDTDIPFAYLSQVRTTVVLYLAIMPLFLVNELGWFTIICVAFFSYVAIGLENLSCEIETPFGYEVNDLPLDEYCSGIARDIRDILQRRYAKELSQEKSGNGCRHESRCRESGNSPEGSEKDHEEHEHDDELEADEAVADATA